jgi:deazaflavin-dependent oxidoreductase (nitroreductase family)
VSGDPPPAVPGVIGKAVAASSRRTVLDERMPLDGEYEISPVGWVREQTEKIFETGTTKSVGINGRSVILLTTLGAKSGKLRKVPLMRVEQDGVYAIVASLGGAPKNPVWYYNVKAEPHVELQDDTDTGDFTAREVTGDEKAVWWERAVEAYPDYADYQKKTDRQIPVFVLEPRAS